jgi:streptomycin 6-kinase
MCRGDAERIGWLERLPLVVRELESRWGLTLGSPFDGAEVSCAWAAPARRRDGSHAVLKIGLPHFESANEAEALRVWDGNGAVRLLDTDSASGALLLERCEPGTHLRALPEEAQDVVIAHLLPRLWRAPAPDHPFRPLSALTGMWADETAAQPWPDAGLVRAGLRLLGELPVSATSRVVLATDLHAGNVLRAQREPWLAIDPKPFVGDPAYDATQHLLNCRERLAADPLRVIGRFAAQLGVDPERVRLWMFARLAADPRDDWRDGSLELARQLLP